MCSIWCCIFISSLAHSQALSGDEVTPSVQLMLRTLLFSEVFSLKVAKLTSAHKMRVCITLRCIYMPILYRDKQTDGDCSTELTESFPFDEYVDILITASACCF